MKKMYKKPEMSIIKMIKFEASDIIRTSGEVDEKPKSLTDMTTATQDVQQLPNSDFSVFN